MLYACRDVHVGRNNEGSPPPGGSVILECARDAHVPPQPPPPPGAGTLRAHITDVDVGEEGAEGVRLHVTLEDPECTHHIPRLVIPCPAVEGAGGGAHALLEHKHKKEERYSPLLQSRDRPVAVRPPPRPPPCALPVVLGSVGLGVFTPSCSRFMYKTRVNKTKRVSL